MSSRVVMPKLTDTMEEGVVLKWKKKEGEAVAAGDVLAEIETDKAVMDLEAFASGTLLRVLAGEGQTVKAGSLIGVIGEPDEDIASLTGDQPQNAPAPTSQAKAKPTGKPVAEAQSQTKSSPPTKEAREPKEAKEPEAPLAQAKSEQKSDPATQKKAEEPSTDSTPKKPKSEPESEPVRVSPRAKALAREKGIDLSSVTGSGPDGRIIENDVLKAAGGKSQAGGGTVDRPLSQMRKAIAKTTTQSKAPVPHFYVTTEIDMEEAERFRHQLRQLRGDAPRISDMILKAAALALARHPEINVSYGGDVIRQHRSVDIGIAVGLEDGLIAPVLRDCGAKSLTDISKEAHALIDRARKRQLKPEEYTGATFSISNLGMFDVENFIAVLVPPEAAALAVGSIREIPVVEGHRIGVGRRMKVTLSCDHRVLDGVQAAKFLKELKRVLEHPLDLVLEPDEKGGLA